MPVPITLIPAGKKSKRINIMIPEALLSQVDSITKNRSEFITKAVEKVLGMNTEKRI